MRAPDETARRAARIIEAVPDPPGLPPRGECHVWMHQGHLSSSPGSAASPASPEGRSPEDARRPTPAGTMRLVLDELVRRYLPSADPVVDRTCGRCARRHGRPVVVVAGLRSALRVSVAHSGGTTVFAFSGSADVGIDVEVVRPGFDWQPMLDLVYSDAEQRQTEAVADPAARRARYYERWVAKEAVLKAMGVGLAGPLNEVDTTGGRDTTWNGWSMMALPVELPLVGSLACAETLTGVHMLTLRIQC